MRPTSLNFCQLHNFVDIIKQSKDLSAKHFLQFQGERPFVINSILEQIKENVGQEIYDSLCLEFSDENSIDYYKSFGKKIYWHYRPGNLFSELLASEQLAGVVISYSYLIELYSKNELFEFISIFFKWIKDRDIEIILSVKNGEELFSSIIQKLDITRISFSIDSKVEVCYRNVDLNKVDSQLKYYGSSLSKMMV